MSMQRRTFLLGSGAALIGLASGRVNGQVPARLAYASLPLSGPEASVGQEVARVLTARLGEAGAISLELLDDAGRRPAMQANYRAALSAGADMLIGVLGRDRGGEAIRVRSQLDRSTPIYVLDWSGAEPRTNVVNLRPTATEEADRIVGALAASGLRRLGIAYGLTPAGRSLRDALVRAAERADLEVVAELSTRDSGFAARRPRDTVSELRQRQVELMLSADPGIATPRMFAAGREFDWAIPWVLTSVCSLPSMEEALGQLSPSASQEGLVAFRAFSPSERERSDYLSARSETTPPWPEGIEAVDLAPPGELGLEAMAQADLVARAARSAIASASSSEEGDSGTEPAGSSTPAATLSAYRWSGGEWTSSTSPSLLTSLGA